MNFEEAVEYLYGIPKFTSKNSLEHTKDFMKRLGNPQNQMKVIHVAGSNGKGSVCSFINQVFMEEKRTVGFFSSPHLTDIRERFRVNGALVEKEVFLEAFHQVMDVVKHMEEEGNPHPSFFEIMFAIGMVIFKKAQVEYAILETGLGGRLDATNMVEQPILTIITSISLEHTEILGDTIPMIAGEKAGIIKQGVPVVFDGNDPEAAQVITQVASSKRCDIRKITKKECKIREIGRNHIDFSYESIYDGRCGVWSCLRIPFVAEYQVMNAALAVEGLSSISQAEHLTAQGIINGIEKTYWPGRMEQVKQNVFVDGAHNVSGVKQFIETVKRLCVEPPILVFSMVQEKDYEEVVRLLSTSIEWKKIIVTEITNPRRIPTETLKDLFLMYGNRNVHDIKDCQEAYVYALEDKKPEETLFVTGSLYLVGELLKLNGGIEK